MTVSRQRHSFFFFLNDPAPTEISPLSLHDALPISRISCQSPPLAAGRAAAKPACRVRQAPRAEARIRIRLFPCSPPTPPESFPLAGYSFVCCLIEPVRFLS